MHFETFSANFYFVTQSANSCPSSGLRARKREATRSAITAAARVFTARNGLNGFTVEQLCEHVGISRRTFFNYFPSKEDAIVGHLLDEFPPDDMAVFLAGGAPGSGAERGPQGLTTTLLQDLFELTCAMAEEMNFIREHIQDLIAAMKMEPQLMLKVLGSAETREHEFAAIIAERENLPPEDPVASMAAAIFGALSRRSSQSFFSEHNTRSYREILGENVRSAQQFFAFSLLTHEGTP